MVALLNAYSAALLIVSLVLFIARYRRQDPPILPYIIIACVCAVSNWLIGAGVWWGAAALLFAASFLFIACLMSPDRGARRRRSPFTSRDKCRPVARREAAS